MGRVRDRHRRSPRGDIAAGEGNVAALTSDGLWGWGSHASGQLSALNRIQVYPVCYSHGGSGLGTTAFDQ